MSSSAAALAVGSSAPLFHLKALGSGREVSRPDGGAALLLVFHDQNSVAAVQAMQEEIRVHYGDAQELLIASVVNMKSVPVFLRSAAEGVMKSAYAKAAAAMPEGLDPADYVLILLDWDGKVSAAFGAHKIDRQPKLVLIDSAGVVRGVHRGARLSEAGLAMVQALFGPDGEG